MTPEIFGRTDRTGPRRQTDSPHPAAPPLGLTEGTIVLTADGEIPVEFLTPGDRIVTRGTGLVPLAGVTRSSGMTRRILFAAGSLGHTRPESDLILPADQRVLVRDWRAAALAGRAQAALRAAALVDGEFIRDLGPGRVRLFQLRFDRPQVIYAGGMEVTGSSLDGAALHDAA